MSDALQAFHAEQIADEILSQRKRRKVNPFRRSEYQGLKSNRTRVGKKYREHQYVSVFGIPTRLLSAKEVAEFREHVQRCMDGGAAMPARLRRAVV